MPDDAIATAEEIGAKKAFRWAVDWPGWCRAGRDGDRALEAFVEAAPRYVPVAAAAGLEFPARPGLVTAHALLTLESLAGGGGTDFGVPSTIGELDRLPSTALEAERLADLVAAAWVVFDRVVSSAPAELRKGPRGGGRDRDRIVEHVNGADHAYAREMGLRLPPPDDRPAVEAMRTAMLEVLSAPSDGSPIGGRKWTPRYAARRVAWHALDHAWEVEDRTDPG